MIRPDENLMKILATEMFAHNHNLKGIDAFRYQNKTIFMIIFPNIIMPYTHNR